MPNEEKSLYQFGPFRVDAARRLLTCDGRAVPLKPKTFDLLLLLVKSRGRVLSKDDLMKALWPDTFVEEANLSFQISILRKALGQHAGEWIGTVPKHGYRFEANVTEVKPISAQKDPEPPALLPNDEPPSCPQDPSPGLGMSERPSCWVRWGRLCTVVVSSVVIMAIGTWWLIHNPTSG